MSEQQLTGGCLCGKVSFSVSGPWIRFVHCHCSRCRKSSGTGHATNLFAHAENFRWTAGESEVRRFDLPTAARFATGFCGTCGGKVPHAGRDGKGYVIPAGTLDQAPDIKPTGRIFWGSRAPWSCEGDDLPRFPEAPAAR